MKFLENSLKKNLKEIVKRSSQFQNMMLSSFLIILIIQKYFINKLNDFFLEQSIEETKFNILKNAALKYLNLRLPFEDYFKEFDYENKTLNFPLIVPYFLGDCFSGFYSKLFSIESSFEIQTIYKLSEYEINQLMINNNSKNNLYETIFKFLDNEFVSNNLKSKNEKFSNLVKKTEKRKKIVFLASNDESKKPEIKNKIKNVLDDFEEENLPEINEI